MKKRRKPLRPTFHSQPELERMTWISKKLKEEFQSHKLKEPKNPRKIDMILQAVNMLIQTLVRTKNGSRTKRGMLPKKRRRSNRSKKNWKKRGKRSSFRRMLKLLLPKLLKLRNLQKLKRQQCLRRRSKMSGRKKQMPLPPKKTRITRSNLLKAQKKSKRLLLLSKFKKLQLLLQRKAMKVMQLKMLTVLSLNTMIQKTKKKSKLRLKRQLKRLRFNQMNIRRQKVKLPRLIKRTKNPNWLINLQKLTRRRQLHLLPKKLLKKRKWPKTAYQHQIQTICQEKTIKNSNLRRARSLKRCSSLRGPSEKKVEIGR